MFKTIWNWNTALERCWHLPAQSREFLKKGGVNEVKILRPIKRLRTWPGHLPALIGPSGKLKRSPLVFSPPDWSFLLPAFEEVHRVVLRPDLVDYAVTDGTEPNPIACHGALFIRQWRLTTRTITPLGNYVGPVTDRGILTRSDKTSHGSATRVRAEATRFERELLANTFRERHCADSLHPSLDAVNFPSIHVDSVTQRVWTSILSAIALAGWR